MLFSYKTSPNLQSNKLFGIQKKLEVFLER